MPRVSTGQSQADFWIGKYGDEAKRVLLEQAEITALNVENRKRPWAYQDVTADDIGAQKRTEKELAERIAWLEKRVQSGEYVESKVGMLREASNRIAGGQVVDELRVIVSRADLKCVPSSEAFYSPKSAPSFDRNQCSGLSSGALVRVLRRAEGWDYVHAGHSVGWLHAPHWTAPLSRSEAIRFRDALPRLVVTRSGTRLPNGAVASLGDSYPMALTAKAGPDWSLLLPQAGGIAMTSVGREVALEPGWLSFTRETLFRLAFSELGRGYGWGESGGLTDCSRMLLDAFRAVGVRLGRHSSEQARSGRETILVEDQPPEKKRAIIRAAGLRGVLLLYMPGHIMLYLGEDQGRLYGLSAINEFIALCPGGEGEVEIKKVVVSDLDVGAGTTRRSFLERMTKVAVFGPQSGAER
jgi:hypothetical protein